MLRSVVLVVALPLAVAGCGGADKSPKAADPHPTPTTASTPSSAPEPTETPSATASPSTPPANVGDLALKVGQWREGLDVRTRVRALVQPSDTRPPSYLVGDSEAEGAIADVEMCVRKSSPDPIEGSLYDYFNVYDKNGGQYSQASSSWDVWPPRPQWPNDDVKVMPGRCIRGWILFSVPHNVRVRSIANDGQDDATAEWLTR
jgi:hypothetical protein